MAEVLIVDDEENLSYSMRLGLQRAGHVCHIVETTAAAMALCAERVPDVAVVDVQLPDGDGIDLMVRMRERGLDVPVIIVTAFGSVDRAVAAMKQGAVDFIQKPLSIEELVLAVERCLEQRRIRNRLHAYEESQRRESGDLRIIGQCPRMREILAFADKIAAVEGEPGVGLTATLLLGETGTGKELIARYIHHHSRRPDRPFVHVNCMAIPQHLFEAELFGYEQGTFTDAKAAKKGLLEMADEGTLFLDEIGDMPSATQAKLLVAIETGRFRRLGATTERTVAMRVIVATNRDLHRSVEAGEFRADLYYRLKMFCVELPPLRERGDDLLLLAEHFLERFSRKFRKAPPALPPETRAMMRSYPWPGNVRELANVLQRAVLVNEGPVLLPESLGIDRAPPAGPRMAPPEFDFARNDCTLVAVERRLIRAALERTGGNVSEAARLLGISRGLLRRRIERSGIEVDVRRPVPRK